MKQIHKINILHLVIQRQAQERMMMETLFLREPYFLCLKYDNKL